MKSYIRECELKDYQEIAILNKVELGYNYPPEVTKLRLEKLLEDKGHKILVAIVDAKVVGYVHACNHDLLYAPHLKNIMGIAVATEYRKNGIGKKLLTEVEIWAREAGSGVRLVSGAERSGAHKFYMACGYVYNKDQKKFIKMF